MRDLLPALSMSDVLLAGHTVRPAAARPTEPAPTLGRQTVGTSGTRRSLFHFAKRLGEMEVNMAIRSEGGK